MGTVLIPTRVGTEQILQWLDEVMDPEVPVVSVVGLGIVREVVWSYDCGAAPHLQVVVTPTYSGCPATEVIAASIRSTLLAHGVGPVDVITRLSPAWTTDWMSDAAREALRAYGIAPPAERALCAGGGQAVDIQALLDPARRAVVPCPVCGSQRTRLLSQFGSTACKALYQCSSCLEPFDYFKPH
ncbi:MAG: 1,2-phenylacetyl-CoA epoxidase subunit PaaD [Burkholderiaceae bacterium]